jgi:putative phosphoesterase
MRVLILSDLHGNAAALEAVAREPHDAVLCLGDIVGYGPEPGACFAWIQAHATVTVRGNHDEALARGTPPRCRPAFERFAAEMAPLGRAQLSGRECQRLGSYPAMASFQAGGLHLLLVHGTPSDPLYRYLGPDAGEWAREVDRLEADIVLVGHTHLQFDLTVGGKRVVNPGSAGQPKDGDPRAAYAVLDDGTLTLKRVAYDVEHTVRGLVHSGASPETIAALSGLLRTGRMPADSEEAR